MSIAAVAEGAFTLEDRYRVHRGAVYLTGIQALVRMLLDRSLLDRRAGLDPATYVSGYEGSPLAGYDLELARRRTLLEEHGVVHRPGLNEELAATAVSGTQLARTVATLRPSGVLGVWYGKAPGLDRASDALRHANLIGTDPHGGALALVGDDPAAKSSSVPCTSEPALADLGLPTFSPADPAEILTHARHAVELSRASGLWSALRISTVVADGAATALVDDAWTPPDLRDARGAYGHRPTAHLLGRSLAELEHSFHELRLPLALEYVRRSGLNPVVGTGSARIGIVAAGSTYLHLRQALGGLGLDETGLARAGIRLLKLDVVFPLEPTAVRDFARGLEQIVVVEDKRGFLEDAVRSVLYGLAHCPPVSGKRRPDGRALFAASGELDADAIAGPLRSLLDEAGVDGLAPARTPRAGRALLPLAARTPFFCSGCPHNSSTEVAPGTLVGGGIGCHSMLLLMPGERAGELTGLSQMGGEGAQWLGMAPFVTQRHFVQNMGDGTFAHSGSLAVRAAVAAGADVTFKLLRNSAVAMTGGQQPVGEIGLRALVELLRAEGVRRVVVTTEDPARVRREVGRLCEVRPREDVLAVQRELAAVAGVTVLVHDQECAAELRRKRRRGRAQAPAERVVINERVCEGCGDCGAKSNCLSVQPVETEFGRKTRINQSSCNVDLSCLAGDCPSFVTVTPGERAASAVVEVPVPADPPPGDRRDLALRITGIGGTGVVTVSQVLATAAAIEGRFVRALDQTGLAQKGGAVVSDLFVTDGPALRSPKLGAAECDLYLGCDSLVATDPANLLVTDPARTTAVVSTTEVPTGHMVIDPTVAYPGADRVTGVLRDAARTSHLLDAAELARRHLGDEQYANMVLVGAAFQSGALPIGAAAIERAIELNGASVAANVAAFRRGRWAVAEPGEDERAGGEAPTLESLVRRRVGELAAYQDRAYAERYAAVVERVRVREAECTGGDELAVEVARGLHKLMAYKDEYEVARLCTDPGFADELAAEFGAGARVRYHLHPPVLRALGMDRKITPGPWFAAVLRGLAGLRRLRGTRWDPFGRAEVRRVERQLVVDYEALVDRLLAGLAPDNHALAVEIAALPDLVRGYEQVKLRSVDAYRARSAELLARFGAAPAPGVAMASTAN